MENYKMKNFKDYALFYDTYYKNKDYSAEIEYIFNLANRFGVKRLNSVLDMGCGTG